MSTDGFGTEAGGDTSLIDVFGFAPREAAQMFESTEGAIKAVLHRARSSLKKRAETNRIERPIEHQPLLIGRFLDAFRNDDPLAIRDIYMELRRTGLQIETFPQGQLFSIFRLGSFTNTYLY